jgi:hypothetical protein
MSKKNVFNDLVTATGLPESGVELELFRLISKAGKTPETLTIDDLRELLAEYLQEVLVAAKKEYSSDS